MRLISLTTVTAENNEYILSFEIVHSLMLIKHSDKKALLMSAFFVPAIFLLFKPLPLFASEHCPRPDIYSLESAKVKWVYDGDTLLLTDKRKIRIIGIDTPEIRHHKQKAQAYGAKAKEALRAKLKQFNYSVRLLYEKEKKDKYARTLAHVFLKDGTNISTWLLEQGYAKTLAIPPNIKFANCYKTTERTAQQNKLKIWKTNKYKLENSASIKPKRKGFIRLKGKVESLKKHKKSVSISLSSNKKKPFQAIIRNKNLRYFESINFDKLIGRSIIVSGMLKNKRNKRVIQLNHSSQLQIIAGDKTKPMIKWSSEQ